MNRWKPREGGTAVQEDESKREAAARRADEALLRELARMLERDDPVPEEVRGGAGRKPGASHRDGPPSGDGGEEDGR
jgi:hypothetical protein